MFFTLIVLSSREGPGTPFDAVLLLVATGSLVVKMRAAFQVMEKEKEMMTEEMFYHEKLQ